MAEKTHEIISIKGTTFIFAPLPAQETASLGVFFRIGSRFEGKKTKGIAHFLEHMLFKGSKKYSCTRIKREIEGRGGSLNAFTSQEITAYYAHFLRKNLPLTLNILLDMALNPTLDKGDIDKERNVILEEIKMYNDLPASRANVLLDQLLFKGHPLSEEVIGHTQTVKNIRGRDLKAFESKYYVPSNMIISFSGNFPRKKMVGLLKKRIAKGKKPPRLKLIPPAPCKTRRIKCEHKDLEQLQLRVGFRSVSYLSRKRIPAQLLHVLLGANMSSRLFEELRERKSLCYDISTELRKYRDSGAFIIHLGLDKSKLKVAIHSILRELAKIKQKKVPLGELSRAKDYLLGQIAMSLERPQGRMFYLAESYLTRGRVYDFEEIKKEVDAITPFQIKELAESLFKFESMCVSCVGNIGEDGESKIKKLIA